MNYLNQTIVSLFTFSTGPLELQQNGYWKIKTTFLLKIQRGIIPFCQFFWIFDRPWQYLDFVKSELLQMPRWDVRMVEAGCPEHKLRAVSARANTTGSSVRRSELLFTTISAVGNCQSTQGCQAVGPGIHSTFCLNFSKMFIILKPSWSLLNVEFYLSQYMIQVVAEGKENEDLITITIAGCEAFYWT